MNTLDKRTIVMTTADHKRLQQLLDNPVLLREKQSIRDLVAELNRAVIVSSDKIPADVVTMRSRIRLREKGTGEESIITLVFPNEANLDDGKISILAPVGVALIGYRVGDVVEWDVPAGKKMLEIQEIVYQPESAGDVHL